MKLDWSYERTMPEMKLSWESLRSEKGKHALSARLLTAFVVVTMALAIGLLPERPQASAEETSQAAAVASTAAEPATAADAAQGDASASAAATSPAATAETSSAAAQGAPPVTLSPQDVSNDLDTDAPWFTPASIEAAGVNDSKFAQAIYDSVTAAMVDPASAFDNTDGSANYVVWSNLGYDGLIGYLSEGGGGSGLTDAEKTAYLLHRYTGDIDASNRGITDITGITLLSDAMSIDMTYNLIQSVEPIAVSGNNQDPLFSNGIDFSCNPIHVWPGHVADITSNATHNFGVSTDVYSSGLKYYMGETTFAKITLGVTNTSYPDCIWQVDGCTPSDAITTPGQTSVEALAIKISTITNGVTTLRCEMNQNRLTSGSTAEVMGSYYNNKWHLSDGTFSPDTDPAVAPQNPTLVYTYNIPVQLYAGVTQDTTVKTYGGLSFTKTSKTDGSALPGAQYELLDENGAAVTTCYTLANGVLTANDITQAMLTTDASGKIDIAGLPAGDYRLVETKAPTGYELDPTPIKFTIASATTAKKVLGGIEDFDRSADSVSVTPEWENYIADPYEGGAPTVPSVTTDSPVVTKTADDYGQDVLLTNYYAPALDMNGQYNNVLEAGDFARLTTLRGEITDAAQAASYDETGTVTVTMANLKTGTPTTETFATLAAAKDYINNTILADDAYDSLTGDIVIKSDTSYVANSTQVYSTAAQSDSPKPVPVYLNLSAGKIFNGGYVTTSGSGKFTYQVVGSDDASDYGTQVVDVAPDGTASSTGTASIGSMKFTKPGTYTYTVTENDPGDAGISYDKSTHVVKAVVTKKENVLTETVTLDGDPVGEWTSAQTTDYDSATDTATEKTDSPAKAGKDSGLSFTNKTNLPTATVAATKALDWPTGAVPANEYSFTLTPATDYGTDVTYSSNGKDVDLGTTALTAGNSGAAVAFPELTFAAKTATYTFTLAEADTAASSSYNKDSATYTATVSVASDATTGTYKATVTYAKADGSAATGASFTNTRKVSGLEVDKAAVGQGASQTQLFDFTLTFDGEYTSLISNDTSGGSTADSVNIATAGGVTVVTYKLNGSDHSKLVLAGVPVGANYTAAETADASYFPNSSWTHTESSTAADNVHTFANQVRTANLYVSKEVQGEHADSSHEFTFDFTFQTPVGSIPFEHIYYKVSDDDGVTYGDTQELAVTSSGTTYSGSLKIHGGQVVEFVDLPVGGMVAYTVDEQADGLYTPNLVGTQNVTITAGDVASGVKVNYVNTKNAPETPATWAPAATKTVAGAVPATVITGSGADGSATTSPFEGLYGFSTKLQSEPAGATVTYGATPTTLAVGSSLAAANAADGTVTFDTLTFDKEGTYTFQMAEDTASTAYVTKDPSTYTVTVPVKYETYVEGGVTKDRLVVDTNNVTVRKDGVAATSVTFDNTPVAPTPTTGMLAVSKTLDGAAPASGAYSFKVTRTGAPDGADAFADRTAANGADGSVNFRTIPYSVAGTYVYEVTETTGSTATVMADTRTYTVTQTVAYDGTSDNKLAVKSTTYAPSTATDIAGGTSSTAAAAFANYTKPTTSLGLTKTVNAAGLASYPTFGYTLAAGTNTAGVTTPMPSSATATTAGAGTASFGDITYEAVGAYHYTVTENDVTAAGWTKDPSSYEWTVTVALVDGKLAATGTLAKTAGGTTSAADAVTFANTYASAGSLTLTADKTLDGRTLADGQFSFQLLDANGDVLQTKTNAADGSVTFDALAFTQADITNAGTGSKTYTIHEVVPEQPTAGYTYDADDVTVSVALTDDGAGKITATPTYTKAGVEIGSPTFANGYASAGSVSLTATKTLEGASLTAGQFSFQLLDANGDVLQTKTNAADGSVTFDAIPYTQDDMGGAATATKTYTVHEVIPVQQETGYHYDTEDVTVSVTLTDDGAGKITAVPTYTKAGVAADAASFTNTYSTTTQVAAVKTGTTQQVKAGDAVGWTITVTNTSSTTVYGTWVKDVAPDYVTLTTCAGGSSSALKTAGGLQYATWFIEKMEPGESVALSLSGTVNADVPENYTIVNVANYEVTGSTTPPDDTKTPTTSTNGVDTPTSNATATPVEASSTPETGDATNLVGLTGILATGLLAMAVGLAWQRRERG